MKKGEFTSLQVKVSTLERIAALRVRKQGIQLRGHRKTETFDEVINRVLDFYNAVDVPEDNEDNFQPDPTPEMIADYEASLKEENEWPTKEMEKAALDSLKLFPEEDPKHETSDNQNNSF